VCSSGVSFVEECECIECSVKVYGRIFNNKRTQESIRITGFPIAC
jgi:hypothetical protein